MKLKQLLAVPHPDMNAICAHLDRLSPEHRVAETLAIGRRAQAKLFEAAKGFRAMTLFDLVPEGTPPMTGVAHEGRNSMLAFTRFAKVFYTPDNDAAATQRWGYNRTSKLVTTSVGPGYYVAYEQAGGEILVDYTLHPTRYPKDGPRFRPNDARLSVVVYNRTQDALRGVSTHVSIGRASRNGKLMDNWFVLCRT